MTGTQVADLRFHRSVLNLLLEQTRLGFVAVVVFSACFAAFSWPHVNHTSLLVWLASLYTVTASRTAYHFYWFKHKDKLNYAETLKITRWLILGIGLSGLCWGAMGFFFVPTPSMTQMAVTLFILTSVTSGAVGALSASLSAIYIFLFPAFGPLVLRFFILGTPGFRLMGFVGAFYLVLLSLAARNVNRMSKTLMRLQSENEDLVRRIHNLGHEVRTPISAIIGSSELLKEGDLKMDEVRRFSEMIYRNSVYTDALVQNILQLSDRDHHADVATVDIRDQIHFVRNLVEPKLKEKNLCLDIQVAPSVPARTRISAVKFQQILINLLNNSIKFTDRGQIQVRVERSKDDRLSIFVSDSGIGIGEEAQAMLFEPFFREDRRDVQAREGQGLGLALSKSLAQSLGGDLKLLRSQTGAGTTFTFDIPAEPI